MIRPTHPEDIPALVTLAEGTGVFKPLEIDALREVLDDYFQHTLDMGHRSITYVQDGQIIGFAYYAPAAMTDRTWYLYWIAVARAIQARGVGGAMLHHVEEDIRKENGRILLLETSSLPQYELTRRFYFKHGYDQAALIKGYYSDGDDMVVFHKRIQN